MQAYFNPYVEKQIQNIMGTATRQQAQQKQLQQQLSVLGLGVNNGTPNLPAHPSPADLRATHHEESMFQLEGVRLQMGIGGNTIAHGWNGIRSLSKASGRLSSVDNRHRH